MRWAIVPSVPATASDARNSAEMRKSRWAARRTATTAPPRSDWSRKSPSRSHLIGAGLQTDAGEIAVDRLDALVPAAGPPDDLGAHACATTARRRSCSSACSGPERPPPAAPIVRRQHAHDPASGAGPTLTPPTEIPRRSIICFRVRPRYSDGFAPAAGRCAARRPGRIRPATRRACAPALPWSRRRGRGGRSAAVTTRAGDREVGRGRIDHHPGGRRRRRRRGRS